MAKLTNDPAQATAALQLMLDRVEIEELFVQYYSGLGGGGHDWFGQFFAEGAELDVNGIICHGRDEIGVLYKGVTDDKPNLTGQFRMLLTNLFIQVDGDTATAQMMWTQTLNETLKGPPRLIEQGLEHNQLARHEGVWKITKRVVVADSGLPDMMDDTYAPRTNYMTTGKD